MSPSHPNRSRGTATPGRNPEPSEVRTLREQMGLTQGQLGELLYSSLRAVQDWESGARRCPGLVWEYANLLWEFREVAAARLAWLEQQRGHTAPQRC